MSERVTSDALQIHAGAGYTTDFAIERYWRDARLTKIFEGTSQIQQRIISDSILGR
ncbi:MAG: acyl-CoA dehydrogenase family protein [Cumulibacter sp.]